MSDLATKQKLTAGNCVPCEGGVPKLTTDQAAAFNRATPEWSLSEEADVISRKLNCGTFVKAVDLINAVSELAESEQHHPDLHLTGYRHLKIVLTTHAIGGLSENDFILAAKIDQLIESR